MNPVAAFLAFSLLVANDDNCAIRGTALDAVTGAPLNKVEITAIRDGRTDSTPFTRTDAHGNFALENLERGQYRLQAKRNGYLETTYSVKPRARQSESMGTPIHLDAGQKINDLSVQMIPFGVIAGIVRDPEGEPLNDVSVVLYRWNYGENGRKLNQIADVSTDDLGQYRAVNLGPGKYSVKAIPGGSYTHTPDARVMKSGEPDEILISAVYKTSVEVKAGGRVTGIDFVLPRSTTTVVGGRATVPSGTRLSKVILNSETAPNEEAGLTISATIRSSGEFEFRHVPPGTFTLTAEASFPKQPTTNILELFARSDLRMSTPVIVGAAPVTNLQIAVQPAAEVTGEAKIIGIKTPEGKAETGAAGSHLTFRNGSGAEYLAVVHEDQTFTTHLPAGVWFLDHRTNSGLVVSGVSAEGRSVMEDGIAVSGAIKISLGIELSNAKLTDGEVAGWVIDKDGAPVAGAIVVLIPELRLRAHADLYMEDETDLSGHFQFRSVAPGKYQMLAWDDVEPGEWFDPEFLKKFEAKGEPLTVEAGGHGSAKLTVIGR